MPRRRTSVSAGKHNFFALCLSGLSVAFICMSFDPAPAGEDLGYVTVSANSLTDVPLPRDMAGLKSSIAENATAAVTPLAQSGMTMDSHDAIMFSLLLMQDGARFVENINTYTVIFRKQERINGDLSEMQSIDLKVRHQPAFSVYMKWQNGDKGRQVLYNEDYDDKKMVVKLGGLKGRLLPGIKLDPSGPEAMAESRYPVTEAGILGMVNQIIVHRQNDLKKGEGVECVRLPNQAFDERDCYCFLFKYSSPEANPVYRKSIILIDSRYHIPLHVLNHTWAKDDTGLSPEQLDDLTLIESYSFSNVDFGRDLVAEEFSRENKAYRM
jgi:hypothetical protein